METTRIGRQPAGQQKRRKKKTRQDALHNVVSLRVTDQEKTHLEFLMKKTEKTASEVLREALALWVKERKRPAVSADVPAEGRQDQHRSGDSRREPGAVRPAPRAG